MNQKHAVSATSLQLNSRLPDLLCRWYRANARDLPWRRDTDPYHVWLSEIMLQQTRVEAVIGYYNRFLAALPTIASLAAATEQHLLKLWEGLGYYNRARNLQKAAQVIVRDQGGDFPDTYEAMLQLPGIGPYTAGAIASICFDLPTPAVDGNVLRVIARLCCLSAPVDDAALKQNITAALAAIYPDTDRGTFTQALMELGATVCIPNGTPKCEQCPAQPLCRAYQTETTAQFPVRAQKTARRIEQRTVWILIYNSRYAIRQRETHGLLAGMWEFPNALTTLSAQQAVDIAADWGAQPYDIYKTIHRTHIFTHIEWNMTCHVVACGAAPDRFTWADRSELERSYALPTAFRLFLKEL